MDARRVAGFNAKKDGHAFERALAQKLGDRFIHFDDGQNKTDLMSVDQRLKISLKNSALTHTQVALIAQQTLADYLGLSSDGVSFIKLFFGFADGSILNQNKLNKYDIDIKMLSRPDEVMRNRLLFKNIPEKYSQSFMDALNNNELKDNFFNKLIVGKSNIIAWTRKKNNIDSVQYALMSDLIALLKKGVWKISSGGSTIELKFDGTRLMYVQMKGSSTKYSAGYHSCMFHLYRSVMDRINIVNDVRLIGLD
jgi:hypothetical protein